MNDGDKYYRDEENLLVERVGPWAKKKLGILSDYVQASSATRAKFSRNNPSYIDLFSGPAKALVRDSNELIDGSPLVAFYTGKASKCQFSEFHIADVNSEIRATAVARLLRVGASVYEYEGIAQDAIEKILTKINPYGLHFVFLDPFNIGTLSFKIFEHLARLKYVDILVHVSVSDLQRNVDLYSRDEQEQFDSFAPGWREKVGTQNSKFSMRAKILEHWSAKIEALGLPRAQHCDLITGSQHQRLYWFMFISGSSFARDLWQRVRSKANSQTLFD